MLQEGSIDDDGNDGNDGEDGGNITALIDADDLLLQLLRNFFICGEVPSA